MPTYDYKCENCGYDFERFQSITARPICRCPRCGQRELKRLIGSGSGLIFKGSGFYETDYRSESYKKAQNREKGVADTGAGEKKTATKTKTQSPAKKPN